MFNSIIEYYEYIYKLKQDFEDIKCLDCYDALSKSQRADFRDWLVNNVDLEDATEVIDFLEER